MPRYSGWGGGWPFMYMHQPGGWGEQTWGMGFGNRNNNNNSSSNSNNNLNIDNLSGFLARLILQNHLTRLADIGCHGGALYGCSAPSPTGNSHPHAHCHGGGGMNAGNNRCHQVCVHTCPNATQPYMGANNVFVVPAAHVHQQQQQQQQQPQQPQQAAGLAGANLNNINMFLNSLGIALGGINPGCGGGGLSLSPGFGLPGVGAGLGQVNFNGGGFNCASCCNHTRM